MLGLISLRNNSLDVNDRDVTGSAAGGGKINIQNWPIFGMYEPDAISSFKVNNQTYYITANEGDARDWVGFAEEARAGDGSYILDPAIFPNAAFLKQNINLGRMTVTRATGNTDSDAEYEQIHVLGGRSFSIWNSNGQLIYDSGNELERLTAELNPSSFNSDGTPASFDTRSDNKGPEIEGVTVGVINGVPYAFVGSERTGDIFVYDLTNPLKPEFKQYINTPEDLGVEGVSFVPSSASPTDKPILITSAETSKTVTIYEINAPAPCIITAVPSNIIYTGGIPTNIFLGYGPQQLTLNVSPISNSSNPYSYSWSGGPLSNYNSANPVFTATEAGNFTFTVTITSPCGLSTTCSITVCVSDIRVTGQPGKVYICHAPPGKPENAKTHAISVNSVAEHLANHSNDKLGTCSSLPCSESRVIDMVITEEPLKHSSITVSPNPSSNYFTLNFNNSEHEAADLIVRDMQGRALIRKLGIKAGFRFGHDLISGTYIAEINSGGRRQVFKLVKQ